MIEHIYSSPVQFRQYNLPIGLLGVTMKFRLCLLLAVLICSGCGSATVNTDVASTKWRMENLEQRFLDFRDKAAMREAKLSSRIQKLEKELGLPVSTQEELILTSTSITPDIHIFMNEEKYCRFCTQE